VNAQEIHLFVEILKLKVVAGFRSISFEIELELVSPWNYGEIDH
jgi:hypothetical protein